MTGQPGGRRVRVLYMIDSLGQGGAEQTLRRIVEGVDRSRFEPRVAVLQARQGNLADHIQGAGIPVDLVRVDRIRSIGGHARLLRYLLAVRPDIIHTHLEFSHTLGGVYGRLTGTKPVATVHTFALGAASREKKRLALMWFSLRAAHVAVIVPSQAGSEHVGRVGRVPASKLLVMHNGVDLETFRPDPSARRRVRERLQVPEGAKVLATVAVLRKEKGVADLIEAMVEISSLVPETVALIVGDGEERQMLIERVEQAGMVGRIIFAGHRDDVPELMAASDVFVLPTHEDLLPTVVAEAMGVGLPVVASDVGGLREMVDDSLTGVLYPAGDVPALVKACVELLVDGDRAQWLGRAGRSRAEAVFDLERQVGSLEQVYLDSLAR